MSERKKVGLALGAGAAKGFAHIGVLQVFKENDIQIDMIAGASVGAIIGGIYSVGGDMGLLAGYFSTLGPRDFLDRPQIMKGGVLSGGRLQEIIRTFTHDKSFGETNIPFVCTAVDVETGERLTLNRGKLHSAIRASMSLAGVFEPVKWEGRLLIDGATLGCVPCKELRDMGADIVIGVDVSWQGEKVKLDPPSFTAVIDQTIAIMQWEITKLSTKYADIMLSPRVGYMGWFGTRNASKAIEEGRRIAEEMLPEIRELLGMDVQEEQQP